MGRDVTGLRSDKKPTVKPNGVTHGAVHVAPRIAKERVEAKEFEAEDHTANGTHVEESHEKQDVLSVKSTNCEPGPIEGKITKTEAVKSSDKKLGSPMKPSSDSTAATESPAPPVMNSSGNESENHENTQTVDAGSNCSSKSIDLQSPMTSQKLHQNSPMMTRKLLMQDEDDNWSLASSYPFIGLLIPLFADFTIKNICFFPCSSGKSSLSFIELQLLCGQLGPRLLFLKKISNLFFVMFLILSVSSIAFGQLKTDFYKSTCPNVESLVRSAVRLKFQQTFVTAPATLRLFFHDCFVRGCDASMLLSSPNGKAEKDHPDNLSLAGDGFDTVVKAKAAVDSDSKCRNKVSCADILALATREVVAMTGGPFYPVELGRRDGKVSTLTSVQHQLPGEGFNLDQLNTMFARRGLSQTDMIALSGAHTLGFSHCNRVSKRLYNFSPKSSVDPTLNKVYVAQLKQMCPLRVDPRIAINMDPTTPNTFDNAYYKNLQQGKGLFVSDQILFTDSRSRNTVNSFASNNDAFKQAFATAMTKLGRVGVLTGNQGEIRFDCTRPN